MNTRTHKLTLALLFTLTGCTAACVNPGAEKEDADEDGVKDEFDNCPYTRNPNQADVDGDGWGNVCDECPTDPLRIRSNPEDEIRCAEPVEDIPDAGSVEDAGIPDAGQPDPVITFWRPPGTPPAREVEAGTQNELMLIIDGEHEEDQDAFVFAFDLQAFGEWSPYDVTRITVNAGIHTYTFDTTLSDQFVPLSFPQPIPLNGESVRSITISVDIAESAGIGDYFYINIPPESIIARFASGRRARVLTATPLASNSLIIAPPTLPPDVEPIPPPACAGPIGSGCLIQGTTLPAIYYIGADGKRYVFPNDRTYRTWYTDYSTVRTVSDADIASIAIGGNVTYRPGTRMIKITTDPKVYAVSKNGVLRWITSESLAVELYGPSWTLFVDDVPDVFFINYSIGADITASGQYDRAAELAGASSINADKNLIP